MPAYRLGCHSYVFSQYGYNQAEQLDEICDTIAGAGFPAIEFFGAMLERPDWYEAVLAACTRNNLRIIGGSSGGALWDAAGWAELRDTQEAYAEQLASFGPGMLCGFSAGGKHLADRTTAENDQVIRAWTELTAIFQARGVTLNYHTHGEPPPDIQFVIDNVAADLLPLGPDLDWLRFGGTDPITFLRANADRLVMLHARDYWLGGTRTWVLGEGDANYVELAGVLDEIGFTGEFVVELAIPSEDGRDDYPLPELLRRSREHIRATMGL